VAPQDSQNCGRDFAKRKQTDAEFAGNNLLRMVIIDIESNTSLGGLTRSCRYALSSTGRCVCFFVCYPKRQTTGIRFTHRPKIRFFAPQGRLVAPIQVNLCTTDGHLGPLAKFHINRRRGVECGSKNIKNLHYLVNSRPAGWIIRDRFLKFIGAFIRLTIIH